MMHCDIDTATQDILTFEFKAGQDIQIRDRNLENLPLPYPAALTALGPCLLPTNTCECYSVCVGHQRV